MQLILNFKVSLTNKPRIPLIILHIQAEEVLLEAADIICLGLHTDSALNCSLIAIGHQGPGAPTIGADPAEGTGGVGSLDSSHHTCYFLVGTEDYGTWG